MDDRDDHEHRSDSERDSDGYLSDDDNQESADDEQEQQEKENVPEGEDGAENEQEEFLFEQPVERSRGKIYITAPEPGQPDKRTTSRQMSPYERTRLIAVRAEMISRDDPPVHPNYQDAPTDNPLDLAELEIDDETIPCVLDVVRPVDQPIRGRVYEIFNARELKLPKQVERLNLRPQRPDTWTIAGQLSSYTK